MWNYCWLLLIITTSIIVGTTSDRTIHTGIQPDYVRRPARSASAKLGGIFGFFEALGNIKELYNEQYNETQSALARVLDIVTNSFSDTRTPKIPTAEELAPVDGTTSTTTEAYAISRKELGYILGKNYRGLRKLFKLELDDALNQTKYNIEDYKVEYGNALAPFTVKKVINGTRKSTS